MLALALLAAGPLQLAAGQVPSDSASGAQTIAFRGVPLSEALPRLAGLTGIDLAYPSGLTEGRRAFCRVRSADPEVLLSCVLKGTGVDYVRSSGATYVLFETLRRSSRHGRVIGTVVDATTGEPLPRANVLLADASTGTTTNASGHFHFGRVLSGTHRIVVTYVGYETQVDSVAVSPDGRRRVRIALEPQPVSADQVVVNGIQRRLPSDSLGRSIVEADPSERLPEGGGADVLRSASSQPGVSRSRPLAQLHVQGGSTGEHVLHLDGVPVRNPVSLGGFLGAFSPLALDRLTVHKTGFGTEHGSYTSGVLSATHDLADAGSHLEVAANPISANGRADLQWKTGRGRSGAAMVALRSSVWPVHRSRSLQHLLRTWTAPDPTLTPLWLPGATGPVTVGAQRHSTTASFSDLHAAVRQPIGAFHELYVSAYRADNQLDASLASVLTGEDGPLLLEARDEYVWGNTAVQARHTWVASSRLTTTVQAYGSWHNSRYAYRIRNASLASPALPRRLSSLSLPESPRETNRVAEGGVEASFGYSPRSYLQTEASVGGQYLDGRFQLRNRFVGSVAHATSAWQWSGHVRAQASLGLQTTLEGGTRLSFVPSRNRVYAEPRLSLRYDRPSSPIGAFAARIAGGLYRQYVTQAQISSAQPTSALPSLRFWLPVDASVAPPRAYHGAASLLLTPGKRWSVQLEGYYKWHPRTHHVHYTRLLRRARPDRMASSPRPLTEQSSFLGAGQGRSYGVDLTLRRTQARVTGELTAGWHTARRRYEDRFAGSWVAAPWEKPVRLAARTGIRLADGLRARARWESIWGRSWALRPIYYDYVGPSGAPPSLSGVSLDAPGADKLAPYHRLDLGLRGALTWQGVTATAEVSLVNVLDRANPFDASLRPKGPSLVRRARTLPGRRIVTALNLRF
ncbi:MAG: carboxypeptidase-like regulatory domain-containing protein [Salinibacter sp.]